MKYEIGDRVLIRDDLDTACEDYPLDDGSQSLCTVTSMTPLYGEAVMHDTIDIDPERYGWTDGMIAGYAEPEETFAVPALAALL